MEVSEICPYYSLAAVHSTWFCHMAILSHGKQSWESWLLYFSIYSSYQLDNIILAALLLRLLVDHIPIKYGEIIIFSICSLCMA